MRDDWNDRCSSVSHLKWYFPLPLRFQSRSHQRHLQSHYYPRNWNFHHSHWNRVLLVVLWIISGENLRRYAEKTDVALGHLVFEGCAFVLEVHYHSFTFTMRDWPRCVSKSELERKEEPTTGEAAWCIYTNSIFPDFSAVRGQRSPRTMTVFISKSRVVNFSSYRRLVSRTVTIQLQFASFWKFSRSAIFGSISEEVWMNVSEEERTEFHGFCLDSE